MSELTDVIQRPQEAVERIAALSRDNDRLRSQISLLKEDAERLADSPYPMTRAEDIESGTPCHYCHVTYKFPHESWCPIELHRQLMKQIEEEG